MKKSANHKKSWVEELGLLVSVPLIIFLLAVGFMVIPSLLAKPQYDFVYFDGYSDTVKVVNGKIITGKGYSTYAEDPIFYYYNAKTDSYKQISHEEARQYRVDPNTISPDGYRFSCSEKTTALNFDGYAEKCSLSKGIAKKELSLLPEHYYAPTFVGWVVPKQ